MRIGFIGIAFVLCISTRAIAEEAATQPTINAAELLEQVVTQFNSAERMALSYRLDETQLPREVDNDELVKAQYRTLQVSLFLHRPGQLDLRGGMTRAPTRFLLDNSRVITEVHLAGREPSAVLFPDPADSIEQMIGGRFMAHVWLHDQFIWLLHADGWKYYVRFAENIRHVGWVRENAGADNPTFARIAFDMFDGSTWEMWIDRNTKAPIRLYVRDELSMGFVAHKRPLEPQGGVLIEDEDNIMRRKTVVMQRERRFDFESIDFNPTFPPEAFAAPAIEPAPRDEPFPRRPTSVGDAMPNVFGKNAIGEPLTIEVVKGEPFVAMSFQPLPRPVPEHRMAPTLLAVKMFREELKDPARIVCFVAEDPSQPVKDLLAKPEFAGATVVYSDPQEFTTTIFQGGGTAIVGRDGRITWNGNVSHPMAFPVVMDELRKALAE